MIDIFKYKPKGDKQNSDFFNEYLGKIYERRKKSGLAELFGDMYALVIQVQTGDACAYLMELYLMTPYRYQASFINKTHKIFILTNRDNAPILFVLEPLHNSFRDDISRLNKMYPNAREKYNARYVGEIYKNRDIKTTKKILISQAFNMLDPAVMPVENQFYANENFLFTRLSDLTYNCVGYTAANLLDYAALNLGQQFMLTNIERESLDAADAFSTEHNIAPLIRGVDHLATRILAGEREDAILEFLSLSKYYFWGAYNIADMNSSTNVTRVPHGDDIKSPAKVFTANNTPFMVNSFAGLPMPTETFVRNYGRRMHHVAYEVIDGDYAKDQKNIDYVIATLRNNGHVEFLAQVFGACSDYPDLKQIFSRHSQYSLLITEYVERCHGFDGFFTKDNVAALTESASLDEKVAEHHKKHGVIGD